MIRGAQKNFDGTILPGEITTMSFEDLMFVPKIYGSEIFTLQGEFCYDYSTHTIVPVCIKDDILEHIQDDTICRLRDDLHARNSGGPLQVLKATQNPVGKDKIQINFAVENLGNGLFYSRSDDSDYGACEFNIENPTLFKAFLVVHPVDEDNYFLDCRGLDNDNTDFENVRVPDGAAYDTIKLRDNTPKSFTCFLEKQPGVTGRVFKDILNIDLYYRYGELIDIPVLIQELSEYGSGTKPTPNRGGGSGPGRTGPGGGPVDELP